MRLTETSVSPTELVDVNLGTAPIAELNLRTVPYYLELWAKAVSKFGYIVVYCRKSARAKVVDKDSKVTIIKLPCKHPLQLKGYYISFRLLGDDFREFEHYLHSIQGAQRSNSIFGKIDYFPFRNNHSNNKSKYAPEIEENQSHNFFSDDIGRPLTEDVTTRPTFHESTATVAHRALKPVSP